MGDGCTFVVGYLVLEGSIPLTPRDALETNCPKENLVKIG